MIPTKFTSRRHFAWFATLSAGILMLTLPVTPALAQVAGIPAFNISEGEGGSTYTLSLQILALMTALTLLPSLVLGMTSFTRIIIVLSILRQAMGTQQTPPNQVLVAIAVFLTLFIMAPTFATLNADVISPYLDGQLPADVALANGFAVVCVEATQWWLRLRKNESEQGTEGVWDIPSVQTSATGTRCSSEDSIEMEYFKNVLILKLKRNGTKR